MCGLDPAIVEHHIDTWSNIVPVWQKQWSIHPSKDPSIKVEIEKLLHVGSIYPIAYTPYMSNMVPVNKRKGTIHVCTNFCYLNLACTKDNFPPMFIDQIIESCANSEIL